MTPAMKLVKPQTAAQKTTRTTVDTIEVTVAKAETWQRPPFQRQLRVNDRVAQLSVEIAHDGVIPGVLSLGVLDGKVYVIDGQHRIEAFKLSGAERAYADVRYHHVSTMGELGEEFVRLNSQLVRLRPDDVLRGLEGVHPGLHKLRDACPFIGYDMVRRSVEKAPMISMGTALRAWFGSANEVPRNVSDAILRVAERVTEDEAKEASKFFGICWAAWGRDAVATRMWSSLNLVVCAWLWRRTVLGGHSARSTRLTPDLFRKCLMTLSAQATYSDWLYGRTSAEKYRTPAYGRVKAAFVERLLLETGKKAVLPAPAWAHGDGR